MVLSAFGGTRGTGGTDCNLYPAFCILHSEFCILYYAFCNLFFAFCIVHSVFFILYSDFCIPNPVFRILYFRGTDRHCGGTKEYLVVLEVLGSNRGVLWGTVGYCRVWLGTTGCWGVLGGGVLMGNRVSISRSTQQYRAVPPVPLVPTSAPPVPCTTQQYPGVYYNTPENPTVPHSTSFYSPGPHSTP